VVVIGAGVGGLTAAALLARAGLDVTVVEAHVYPGGCAGTFYHRGYRFDAGATLAGGFARGAPMHRLARLLDLDWPGRPTDRAMTVWLPHERRVRCWSDRERWRGERIEVFGNEGEPFWAWQERAARALWRLSDRLPPWPPQGLEELLSLAAGGMHWIARDLSRLGLGLDAVRPVDSRLRNVPERMRLFLDAQLLISAQCQSDRANALFGAAALDLPHRGILEMEGGMGAIAGTLAGALERLGGVLRCRSRATRIVVEDHRSLRVECERGLSIEAGAVLVNLPLPSALLLLGSEPSHADRAGPRDGWGAFMVHAGIDAGMVPEGTGLHHLVVPGRPLGDTRLEPWWRLFHQDRPGYEERRNEYMRRALETAEQVLPSLASSCDILLPGTPVTFRRFTGRARGWVGGYPQTHLGRVVAPRLQRRIWLVGDSIFPGQSTAAVALGGMRVAAAVLKELTGAAPPDLS
jgi:phytoene dehydrogenase-like protein